MGNSTSFIFDSVPLVGYIFFLLGVNFAQKKERATPRTKKASWIGVAILILLSLAGVLGHHLLGWSGVYLKVGYAVYGIVFCIVMYCMSKRAPDARPR
jgi:uncharacterized membrane protein YeiB